MNARKMLNKVPEVTLFFWVTSYIYLGCILAPVTFLSITKRDQSPAAPETA